VELDDAVERVSTSVRAWGLALWPWAVLILVGVWLVEAGYRVLRPLASHARVMRAPEEVALAERIRLMKAEAAKHNTPESFAMYAKMQRQIRVKEAEHRTMLNATGGATRAKASALVSTTRSAYYGAYLAAVAIFRAEPVIVIPMDAAGALLRKVPLHAWPTGDPGVVSFLPLLVFSYFFVHRYVPLPSRRRA